MKHLLLISVLLLGASWALAQTGTTPSSPSQSGSTTQSSPSGSTTQSSPSETSSGQTAGTSEGTSTGASSGANTIQGCLSGSDGNYMLMDKSGNSYQLTGDTAKLSQHIGHEVAVTGTPGSASGSSGAAGSSSGAMGSGSSGSMGHSGANQTIEVTSVKHIAKTCQSGGAH